LIKKAELEADRLGIAIVARAGYNTETAARFLPRLAKAFPTLNEPHAAYHTPAARAASIRLAIDEIARQEARNDPHQALQGLAPPIWP
jgi:predicted Zn-dependent protease